MSPFPEIQTTQERTTKMPKNINVDKLIATLDNIISESGKRKVWAKTDAQKAFEDGYARCASNLRFAIATATA